MKTDWTINLDVIVSILGIIVTLYISWPEIKNRLPTLFQKTPRANPIRLPDKRTTSMILAWSFLFVFIIYFTMRIGGVLSNPYLLEQTPMPTNSPTPAMPSTTPFQLHWDNPVDVILVVDTSGSMSENDRFGNLKKEIDILLNNMTQQDRVGLITFGDTAKVWIPVGIADDAQKTDIRNVIFDTPREGQTAINDALAESLDMLNSAGLRPGTKKQIIIIMTDGADTQSSLTELSTLDAVSDTLAENDTLKLIPVAYGDTTDTEFLYRLAKASSTQVYFVNSGDSEWMASLIQKYFQK